MASAEWFQAFFYGLVAVGLGAVSYTGYVTPFVAALALLSLPAGWWLDARQQVVLPVRWAGAIFVLVIGVALAEYFLLGFGWFYAVLDLLVLVTGIKLISPKANRDYVQLIAVGFLLMLATSVLTTDSLFSIFFLLYVFLLAWTLMVFTVKVVLERDPDPVRSPVATRQAHLPPEAARGLLEGRLFGSASAVITIVLIFTVVFFMVFPRFGAGIIGGSLGNSSRISGLSDEIRFDAMDALKPDNRIALRIQVIQGQLPLPAYLKGNVLDSYSNHAWSATRPRQPLPPGQNGNLVFAAVPTGPALEYRILADDLGVQTVPLVAGTWWLHYKSALLFSRGDGTVFRSNRFQGSFGFDGRSVPGGYRTEHNLMDAGKPSPWMGAAPDATEYRQYLQLDDAGAQAASRLLREAGVEITVATTRAERLDSARLLSDYLRETYTYSLVGESPGDPLQNFLDRKAGHCEHFATLLALSLRRLGVPARIVTGYYGGELSEFGNHIEIRNSDAHAWVEVWLGDYGWVAFDPTPPYFDPNATLWATTTRRVRSLIDLYNVWWISRVVSYDLADQVSSLEKLQKGFSLGTKKDSLRANPFAGLSRTARWALVVALAVIALAIGWMIFRPRRGESATTSLTYSRPNLRERLLLRAATLRWGSRQPHETWSTYVDRIASIHASAARTDLFGWLRNYSQRRYRRPSD